MKTSAPKKIHLLPKLAASSSTPNKAYCGYSAEDNSFLTKNLKEATCKVCCTNYNFLRRVELLEQICAGVKSAIPHLSNEDILENLEHRLEVEPVEFIKDVFGRQHFVK